MTNGIIETNASISLYIEFIIQSIVKHATLFSNGIFTIRLSRGKHRDFNSLAPSGCIIYAEVPKQ